MVADPTKRLFRVAMLDPSQGFIDPWGKFGDLGTTKVLYVPSKVMLDAMTRSITLRNSALWLEKSSTRAVYEILLVDGERAIPNCDLIVDRENSLIWN
ncbi:hypothetical protein Tco_0567996 [Tanacetum coccineum]